MIADILLNNDKALVIADSAEPKSIDEIRGYGVNIVAAEKGKDSVCSGIQLVQDQRIEMTSQSINLIKEYRNYLWETDKQGIILNVPEHAFSHSMDAVRYGMVSMLKQPSFKAKASAVYMPHIEKREKTLENQFTGPSEYIPDNPMI